MCNYPPECEQSEIDQTNAECGEGNVEYIPWQGDPNFPQCQWRCKDDGCDEEYDALEASCTEGIASFDSETCTGECLEPVPEYSLPQNGGEPDTCE